MFTVVQRERAPQYTRYTYHRCLPFLCSVTSFVFSLPCFVFALFILLPYPFCALYLICFLSFSFRLSLALPPFFWLLLIAKEKKRVYQPLLTRHHRKREIVKTKKREKKNAKSRLESDRRRHRFISGTFFKTSRSSFSTAPTFSDREWGRSSKLWR